MWKILNGKKLYIVTFMMHPTYFDTPDELPKHRFDNSRLRNMIYPSILTTYKNLAIPC